MEIIDVPHFLYSGNDSEGIRLDNGNIEEMLKKINLGENIFDVIPDFKESIPNFHIQMHFLYGRFVTKSEVHVDDRVFYERYPKQIGKLMVPYYNVKNREDMISETGNSLNSIDRNKIILDSYSGVDSFYRVAESWIPLYPDRTLKLSEKQLGLEI